MSSWILAIMIDGSQYPLVGFFAFVLLYLLVAIEFMGCCRAPKFLVDPLGGPSMAMRKELELGARSRLLALEGG
jgi:hypothetical protein